ncbi:hypothetical protein BCR43DRAFT_492733 [Syncephalastrum racemosum]|uniref:NADH dehydrogenase [ubiquinone] 1 beta subcomplex subunit 11, mitochondrial n=1 Tax=Syncephalastrum racemosum TaxID=13706 RepID=A0A1X2H9D1_SYNRA|nr:hypothetical protein BCR43DRAFT_492733 [Syncephalastrum racemosum]
MLARAFARSARLSRPTTMLRRGGGGGSPVNEPGGYLFSEKTRVKEDWENMWYAGMFGGFALVAVGLYYKPDTTVTTWATKQAEKNLKEKGISIHYEKSD